MNVCAPQEAAEVPGETHTDTESRLTPHRMTHSSDLIVRRTSLFEQLTPESFTLLAYLDLK